MTPSEPDLAALLAQFTNPMQADEQDPWKRVTGYEFPKNLFPFTLGEKGVEELQRQFEGSEHAIHIKDLLGAGSGAIVFTVKEFPEAALRFDYQFVQDGLKDDLVMEALALGPSKEPYSKVMNVPTRYYWDAVAEVEEKRAKGETVPDVKDTDNPDYLAKVRARLVNLGERHETMDLVEYHHTMQLWKRNGAISGYEEGPDFKGIIANKQHIQDAKIDQFYTLKNNKGETLTYPDGSKVAVFGDVGGTISKNVKETDANNGVTMSALRSPYQYLLDSAVDAPLTGMLDGLIAIGKGKAPEAMNLFPGWEKILPMALEQNRGELQVKLKEPLPESWRQSLREIRWDALTHSGDVTKEATGLNQTVPEALLKKVETLFEGARIDPEITKPQVYEPKPEAEETVLPLKLIDRITPPASDEDLAAARGTREAKERVQASLAGSHVAAAQAAGHGGGQAGRPRASRFHNR